MPRIFISYRRSDTSAISGRIYDRLIRDFDERRVFKDVDDIPPGADFRRVLDREVSNCDVLLVIMGPGWTDVRDEHGHRRLDDPDDFVRIEVEAGLRQENVLVIPVLVSGARIPAAEALPGPIRDLIYRNAIPVRDDPDFHRDMTRLVQYIQRAVPARRPTLPLLGAALVAVVVIGALLLLLRPSSEISPDDLTQTASVVVAVPSPSIQAESSPTVQVAADTPQPAGTLMVAAANPDQQLDEAVVLIEQGRIQQALALINLVLAVEDDNARALRLRAAASMAQDELEAAEMDLRAAGTLEPDSVDLYVRIGDLQRLQGERIQAEANYLRAFEQAPNSIGAVNGLLALYTERDEIALADGVLARAINANPEDPRLRVLRGDLHRGNENNTAREYYDAAIALDPDYAAAYIARAQSWLQDYGYEPAIADLTRAIELDPAMASAWMLRGEAKLALEDFEGAISDFGEAIQRNPDLGMAYMGRARAQARQGEQGAALLDYTSAARVDPSLEAQADFETALVYQDTGDFARAQNAFDAAIASAPDVTTEAQWRSERGWFAYNHLENYTQALNDFEEVVQLTPDDPAAWHAVGLARSALGQAGAALEAYNTALSKAENPDTHTYIYLARGITLQQLGRINQAVDDYATYLAANPNDFNVYNQLAEVAIFYWQDGDRAIDYAQQAVELSPPGAIYSHLLLAQAYETAGDLRLALGWYEDYEELGGIVDDALRERIENVRQQLGE